LQRVSDIASGRDSMNTQSPQQTHQEYLRNGDDNHEFSWDMNC